MALIKVIQISKILFFKSLSSGAIRFIFGNSSFRDLLFTRHIIQAFVEALPRGESKDSPNHRKPSSKAS